jgi:hypothetical protein
MGHHYGVDRQVGRETEHYGVVARAWTVTLHQRIALKTELVDQICGENATSSQRMTCVSADAASAD